MHEVLQGLAGALQGTGALQAKGQAVAVALALGLLVATWGRAHFNEPQPVGQIRFSVPRRRYFFALGVHVTGIVTIYAVAYAFLVLTLHRGLVECVVSRSNLPSGDTCQSVNPFSPEALIWSAVASALFVRLAVPNLPFTRWVIDRLRFLTHELALFPFALQSLVSVLAKSRFSVWKGAEAALRDELGRYGVSAKWELILSPSTRRSLLEVHSLRWRLIERVFSPKERDGRKDSIALAAKAAEDEIQLPNNGALREFRRARSAVYDQLETDFRRLVRRTALALLLAEEISERIEGEAFGRAISDFVAEECDEILVRYRRLIAEAALSSISNRTEQARFLASFGYETPASPSLPLFPWVVVFVFDFILFIVPSVLMWVSDTPDARRKFSRLAVFAFAHAISQSVAITWAIYPKIVSNFARPSLYSLPWQSYVVFGMGSYLTGAATLFVFRLFVPLGDDFEIVRPTLLSSLSFLLMAVGVSALIDLRLLSSSLNFTQGRLRDGAIMAALMLVSPIVFQLVIFGKIAWVPSSPESCIRFGFLALAAILGGITGYLVPSAAAAYLQRSRLGMAQHGASESLPKETKPAKVSAGPLPEA